VIIWNHRVSSPVVIITMIDNPSDEVSDNSGKQCPGSQQFDKAVRNAGDHKGNYRSKEDFLGSLQIERWINEKTLAYKVWMDLLK